MRSIRENRTKTESRKEKFWLLISYEYIEFLSNGTIFGYHRTTQAIIRLMIKCIPLIFIPDLMIEESRSKSFEIAIPKYPWSVESMSTENSSIFRHEYIEIFHNIKLFTTDTMLGGKFIGMRYIEITLRQEKKCNDTISYKTWKVEQNIDNTIRCHQDEKYIKKHSHYHP